MLHALRNYLAEKPLYFTIVRKIIELNFKKQKTLIRKVFGNISGKRILDIGCGTGEFSGCFQNAEYCGIDISPAYIAFAKKREKKDFRLMDAKKMDFPDGSFDGILIVGVLHHLSDNETKQVLQEARRILKKEGTLLIVEDAKIPHLETPLVRVVQYFDKGDYIRQPAMYKNLITPHFRIIREGEFRNGVCVYYYFYVSL